MDEMCKYICKDSRDRITCFVIGLVFAAAAVVLFIRDSSFLATAMLCIGLVLFFEAFTAGIRDRKKLKKQTADGTLEKAAADFASAVFYADGEIKLGDEYIFRRQMSVIISYADIVKAEHYQSSDVQNRSHNDCIRVKLKNGRYEPLCTVYGVNKKEEINDIFSVMKYYNPSIEFSNPFVN